MAAGLVNGGVGGPGPVNGAASGAGGAVPTAPATGQGTGTPPTADQLVSVLSPLRADASGIQRVSFGLQPEGMGTVQATVSLDSQSQLLTVHLAADTPQAHHALSEALPDLRRQMNQGGATTTVHLSSGWSAGRDGGAPAQPDRPSAELGASPAATGAEGVVPVAGNGAAGGDRLVDLRL
jgi:hypothetical protein